MSSSNKNHIQHPTGKDVGDSVDRKCGQDQAGTGDWVGEKPASKKVRLGEDDNGDDDEIIDLVVGGYSYSTTRKVLLQSPFLYGKETYFHTVLSGRWDDNYRDSATNSDRPKIEIPNHDGRLFFYVLYYLQLGQLPRDVVSGSHNTLLNRTDIAMLKEQADFFGLSGLLKLCQRSNNIFGPMNEDGNVGTGDIDLSPFSNFSFTTSRRLDSGESQNIEVISMEYTYQNRIHFRLMFQYGHLYYEDDVFEIWVCPCCAPDDNNNRTVINEDTFHDKFEDLKKTIEQSLGDDGDDVDDKNKNDKQDRVVSVKGVLEQSSIAPELYLFYAFIIDCMIGHYRLRRDWLFRKYDDDGEVYFSHGTSMFFNQFGPSFFHNLNDTK
jgi:hypothetical protein